MTLPQAVQFLHIYRACLALVFFVAVGGCGETKNTGPGDAASSLGDGAIETETYDPVAVPPYGCDYSPAGSFTPVAGDECNLLNPLCNNPDDACVLTDLGTRCLPPGTDTCGDACDLVNDCERGLMCVGEPKACRAACRPGDPCPGNTICRAVSGRDDVGFCPIPCSVLEPDCPDGQGCYLLFGKTECATTPPDAGGLGEACDAADDCVAGLVCQDASNLRCLQPCSTSGTSHGCDAGQSCLELQGLAPLGVCVAP